VTKIIARPNTDHVNFSKLL